MKNLQNLHLSMICGDIMVKCTSQCNSLCHYIFAALTLGVVFVYVYIKALAKLFDWLDKKLGK